MRAFPEAVDISQRARRLWILSRRSSSGRPISDLGETRDSREVPFTSSEPSPPSFLPDTEMGRAGR